MKKISLIFLLLTLAVIGSTQNFWESINVNTEYNIFIEDSSGNLYSWHENVQKSTDNGKSWTNISNEYVNVIEIDKSTGTIFYSNGYFLFKTDDEFVTIDTLFVCSGISCIKHCAQSGVLLFGTDAGELYQSLDGGLTFNIKWQDEHLYDVEIATIVERNDGIILVGLKNYMSDLWYSILISNDAGNTWNNTGIEINSSVNSIDFDSNNNIYACYNHAGIAKSSDDGQTWIWMYENNKSEFSVISSMIIDVDDNIYISINKDWSLLRDEKPMGVYKYYNGEWVSLCDSVLLPDTWINRLYITSSGYLFAIVFNIYRSINSLYGTGLLGDADSNGIVDINDILCVISYLCNHNPHPFSFTNADVNSDGNINILDIILIVNIIMR